MTFSSIILRALKKIISILEKRNLDWCLFGGLAMQAYKRIRATKDLDLMVGISANDILNFITQMEKADFVFERKKGSIRINGFELLRFISKDEDTGFEIFIDLVTANTEFQKQILRRKNKIDFLGIGVNIASLEDIILLKLLADRPIDLVDAKALFEENKDNIDKNYLRKWAKRLNLIRRLKNLLRENA